MLTLFGAAAVTACTRWSAGTRWSFGVVGVIWAAIAFRRYRQVTLALRSYATKR